jgi:hypothetical protein
VTLRVQIILSVVLGLMAGFIVFCHFYPLIRVSGYRLVANGSTIDTGAENLSADTSDANFFRQPLADYSTALLGHHPEFSSVNCRMNIWGEVVCEGVSKKPIAIVCLPQVYGLSCLGEILPFSESGETPFLPLVTGVRLKSVEPFTIVSSPELQEALRICRLLRSDYSRIGAAISEIDFGSCDSPLLYFRNSDVRVILGRGNYRQKLASLDLLLNRLEGLPAGELDLRYGRSVIARDLT